MMATVLLIGVLFAVLAFLAVRAWREHPAESGTGRPENSEPSDLLLPTHFRYYPQIRQTLSRADREYLVHRALPGVRRRWEAERRRVVRGFLAGLKEDFLRLERLGRTVASLSPELSHELERERLWLGMRFRFWYSVMWLTPAGSQWTVRVLDRATGVVGSIANRTTAAMTEIGEATNRQA